MSTLVCFNLSLTQGPISGWNSPIFIAPLIISIFTGIRFFIWETKVYSSNAMLPKAIWKIPNAIIATLAIMVAFPFWATTQVQYATYYQDIGHWPPTRVAAAMLPQGVVAVTVGIAVRFIPGIVESPGLTISLGATCRSFCSINKGHLTSSDDRRRPLADLFFRWSGLELLEILLARILHRFSRRLDSLLRYQVSTLQRRLR